MICETCHGAGYLPARVLDNQRRGAWVKLPCTDCGGSGIVHCCEGDRMTEDEDEDA